GGPPPPACKRGPPFIAPLAAFPASVAALQPTGAPGLRGRTIAAVSRTVREAAATRGIAVTGFASAPRSLAGPFGGRIAVSGLSFSLTRYSVVPGLEVTGRLDLDRPASGSVFPLRFVGSVKVGGAKAAPGSLHVGRSKLS